MSSTYTEKSDRSIVGEKKPQNQTITPKRIVLTTLGSLGDLHPYIALALELKARGHQPVIATCDSHRSIVESAGISFCCIRPNIEELGFGNEQAVMQKTMHLRTGLKFLFCQTIMPNLQKSYADLSAVCDQADLLISHPLTLSAQLVAEKKRKEGLDWVSVVLAPSMVASAYDPAVVANATWLKKLEVFGHTFYSILMAVLQWIMIRPWMRPWHRFRQELGLPKTSTDPIFDKGQFSPSLTLALFSEVLAKPQPDWPANTLTAGFLFYDQGNEEAKLDPDLEEFLNAGEAPIVFTLGSAAVMSAGDFYTQSAIAAEKMGKRAVLLVGKDPSNRPANLSERVVAFEYAPYSLLFPRALVIVHQGGIGTTAQTLHAGRPMLVVPFAFDQPDNAYKMTRLGVARTLPRARYHAKSAEKELTKLCSDVSYQKKAEYVAKLLHEENGINTACDAIESLFTRATI